MNQVLQRLEDIKHDQGHRVVHYCSSDMGAYAAELDKRGRKRRLYTFMNQDGSASEAYLHPEVVDMVNLVAKGTL